MGTHSGVSPNLRADTWVRPYARQNIWMIEA